MVEQTGPAETERLSNIARDTWENQHPGEVNPQMNHVNKTDSSNLDVDSTNPDQTGSGSSDSAKDKKLTPPAINVTESDGDHYKCEDHTEDQTTVPLVVNTDNNPNV